MEAAPPIGDTPPTGIGDIPVAAIQEAAEDPRAWTRGSGVKAAAAAVASLAEDSAGWKHTDRSSAPSALARRSASGSEVFRAS